MADGRVEGEGGGEEGLELLLPQLDGKRACQGVEQTWLALHLQQNIFCHRNPTTEHFKHKRVYHYYMYTMFCPLDM